MAVDYKHIYIACRVGSEDGGQALHSTRNVATGLFQIE